MLHPALIKKSRLATVLAILSVFLVAACPVFAQTSTWTNTVGGVWGKAANWSPNQVPGSGSNVIITNAGTYTVTNNGTVTIGSIILGGATGIQTLKSGSLTLTTPSTINSNGVLNFSSGSGPSSDLESSLTVLQGGTLTISNTVYFGYNNWEIGSTNTATLTNYGTVIWAGPIYAWGNDTANPGGAIIDNAGDWQSVAGNTIDLDDGNPTNLFVNTGTLENIGGTGTSAINWNFTSTGTINTPSGTFTLNWNVGTNTLHGNATLIATTLSAPLTVASNAVLNLTGSSVTGYSDLESSLTVLQGGTLTFSNTVYFGYNNWEVGSTNTATLTNYGTVIWAGEIEAWGNGTVHPGAAIIDNAGLWQEAANNNLSLGDGDPTNLFFNTGTLEKTGGTGIGTIYWNFASTGTINTPSGTFTMADWDGGPSILNGNLTLNASYLFVPLTVASNAVLNLTGTSHLESSLTVLPGGMLTLSNTIYFAYANWGDGSTNTAVLTNDGTVIWAGTIEGWGNDTSNPGSVFIYNAGVWQLVTDNNMEIEDGNPTNLFYNTGTLEKISGTNTSTINWNFASTGTLNTLSGNFTLDWNGPSTLNGNLTLNGTTIYAPLTVASSSILNLTGDSSTTSDLESSMTVLPGGMVTLFNTFYLAYNNWADGVTNTAMLTNEGTVICAGAIQGWGNDTSNPGSVFIDNAGVWQLVTDNNLEIEDGNPTNLFYNTGTLEKIGGAGGTSSINWNFSNNGGILGSQTNTLSLAGSYDLTGGALNFGLNSLANYGKIHLSGNPAILTGTISANLNGSFVPSISNAFPVLTFTSYSGAFTNSLLPSAMNWQTTYNPANVTISVVKAGLGKLAPLITWANPATIVYGVPLGSSQLDATATSPTNSSVTLSGTFTYNPPLATVLFASNNQTLAVTFTPADQVDYSNAAAQVTINVLKEPLSVTANNQTKTAGQTVIFAGAEFTTSGLRKGDSVTSVSLSSPGAAASATVAGSPYPITVSNAVGTGLANYTITYINGLLTVNPAAALTYPTLYDFSGSDGNDPFGTLLLSGKTLYGTTAKGGSSSDGTVFAINTNGTGFANLFSFNNTDGATPQSGLILSGNTLYGTTFAGGSSSHGTLFAIHTNGTGFTTLYNFTNGSDGSNPNGSLLLSANTLYGTTYSGGSSGDGTVFAIKTDGTGFTNMYNFTNGSDGGNPCVGLILSGNTLYGTTLFGNGTVFAINTNGKGFTNLFTFPSSSGLFAGLMLAGNTLYGTTESGGSSGNGSVFAIHTDGTGFTNLFSFDNSDGKAPSAGLILSGNTLFGTAEFGGSSGDGTVFAINTNGTGFTNLFSFDDSDGYQPVFAVVLSGNTLYGTTIAGGTANDGTVFALNLPATITNAPSLTWTKPASITYGTPLNSTQLDATANMSGSFAYTPAIGAVLNAGNNTLSVIFTPTYAVDNRSVTDTVSLAVSPAPLTVTANNQTKDYGRTLTFGIGSTLFTSGGLQNGETIGSVTLAVNGNGGAATAPVSGSPYTITPSAATGGTFSAKNYSITYVKGLLTVTNAFTNAQLPEEFGDGHLHGPEGIAISPTTFNIFVADVAQLVAFDQFGNYIATYGTSGSGQLSSPIGCAVDAQGNVYVGDYDTHKCVEFTGAGVYVKTFDGQSNQVTLGLPTGVAVDASGHVYVADDANSRVVVFASSGAVTSQFSTVMGNGGLAGTVDIALDHQGGLWVADYYYHQFARYSLAGALLASYGGYGAVVGPGQFSEPYGLTVDANNNIYVTDTALSSVQKFNSSGQFAGFFGTPGSGIGQYQGPNGVAVDRSGHVLVSDGANKRIVVFSQPPVVAITSPTNGASILTSQSFAITAAVQSSAAIATVSYYLDGGTLLGTSAAAPYALSVAAGSIPPGGHQLSATVTDSTGSHNLSAPVLISMTAPGTALIDFDALNTSAGAVGGTALAGYLAQYGVTMNNVTAGTVLEAVNTNSLTGTIQVDAPSAPNFFTQAGLNTPVSFTLNFATALQSFGFARAGLSAASGPVSHPQWTATIFDRSGTALGSVSEALMVSASAVAARSFVLTGANIASVRFDSDSQGVAAFSAVLLDNLLLNSNPTAPELSATLAVVSPNPNNLVAPATIVLGATVTDNLSSSYSVSYFAGANLLGTVSASPYQLTVNNVLAGNYALQARVTDASGVSALSPVVPVTVQLGANASGINFDTLNTAPAPVTGAAVTKYLAGFGVTVVSLSPGTALTVDRQQHLAGGKAVAASSPPNLMTQTGSNGPVQFTLGFAPFLSQFGFTRPALLANPFVSHPAWQVIAFDGAGNVVGQAGEAEIDSSTNVGAMEFSLGQPGGPGIAKVEFASEGSGLTTFNAMLLDDLVLTKSAAAFLPAVALTSPSSGLVLAAPPALTVTAAASDATGITSVSFYANGALLGTDTASPYSIQWTNIAAGNYVLTAVASDGSGLTQTSAGVNVVIQPSAFQFGIASPPASQTVALGGSVTFSVGTTGTNGVAYQWSHNQTPITGATANTLVVGPPIADSDAGTYTVTATVPGESLTSDPAYLTVVDPPVITTQPAAQTIPAGSEIVLTVAAAGGGPFTYQWRLNGTGIPGATNNTYAVPSAQPLNSGNYQVAVANLAVSTLSAVAPVIVETAITIPATNNTFASRAAINPLLGPVAANNQSAVAQLGAPLPDNRPGGNSIWFSWTPAFTGTVSLTTQGSAFDTIMAVYTGSALNKLKAVAADDDSGGFLTSLVTFNVTKGTNYQIAVDGFQGASGRVVLGLPAGTGYRILNPTSGASVPVIVKGPASQAVAPGAKVTLSVQATSATKMSYQWHFQGTPIAGATGSSLVINQLRPALVGLYDVLVANAAGSAQSEPANVQIASNPGGTITSTQNKFINTPSPTSLASLAIDVTPLALGGDTRGFSVSQVFSTVGAVSEPGEPQPCGQVGTASQWFVYTAPGAGRMQISTAGSTYNTMIGVYTGPGTSFTSLVEVGCGYSTNYVVEGQPNVVIPEVVKGTTYYILVAGYQGASGVAQLQIGLGQTVTFSALPASKLLTAGSNTTFAVTTQGSTPSSYQWQLNGANVAGGTKSSYTVTNAQAGAVGNYTVIVSNVVGAVTSSPPAALTLQYAPAIVTGPTNETVTVGKPAKFTVTVMGVNVKTNHFVSQWYFNGAPIPKATNLILSLAVTSLTNSGSYSIIITNSYGSAASVPVTLTVVAKAALASGPSSAPTGGNYSFSDGASWIMAGGGSYELGVAFPAAGTYSGLFYPTNGVTLASAGYFTATVSSGAGSAFSANILLDGGSYAFTGQFDAAGNAYALVPRAGNTSVAVFLNLNLASLDGRMTGVFSNADWTSDLQASRAVFDAVTNPAPDFAGQFTLVLASGTNPLVGNLTVTNTTDGTAIVTGTLTDGATIFRAAPIDQGGTVPLYAPLYSGQGLFLGWVTLTNSPATTNYGGAIWLQPGATNRTVILIVK